MNILQLIDTLEAGGAERMAVNFANALAEKEYFSGLISTRKEGVLKNKISSNVDYCFLKKTKRIDLKATFALKNYLKSNNIDIIHVHGSSFFIAFLSKIIYPRVKIVYHEHLGNRANQSKFQNVALIFCSLFFDKIIVVNTDLKFWFDKNCFTKKKYFLPNFSDLSIHEKHTFLKGKVGKRIVFLANLKNPKNHLFALKSFFDSQIYNQDWTLHLIGKNFNDVYFLELENFITTHHLENQIFIYGDCSDVLHILQQADVGLLASTSEGFPLTLLEYGLAKLAVISTNVGFCKEVINPKNGLLFSPLEIEGLKKCFVEMTSNSEKMSFFANNLHQTVIEKYGKMMVLNQLIEIYKD
jgi:glycosyltransferase involved in cell wall biosynthesis